MSNFLTRARRLGYYLLRADFKAIRASLKRAWTDYLIHRGKPFTYRKGSTRYVCYPDWSDSLWLQIAAGEQLELAALEAWLKPGDLFVDIGANLGSYTFAAACAVGPGGSVLAIEANRYVADRLDDARQILGWKNIAIENVAISDHEGEVTLWVAPDNRITFESSLSPEWARDSTDAQTATSGATKLIPQPVRATTLQKLSLTAGVPSMVKLDIEGAEIQALSATPQSWLTGDTFWLVEINPTSLARSSGAPADITKAFSEERFHLWIVPQGKMEFFERPRPLESAEAFADAPYYNLLAIPKRSARASAVNDLLQASALAPKAS